MRNGRSSSGPFHPEMKPIEKLFRFKARKMGVVIGIGTPGLITGADSVRV
jgi:hypothetical protein